jgi:hypothetical protein
VKPPGKFPPIAGAVLVVLYFVLTFQASAAYDSSCHHDASAHLTRTDIPSRAKEPGSRSRPGSLPVKEVARYL